jgi:hypothetical protein
MAVAIAMGTTVWSGMAMAMMTAIAMVMTTIAMAVPILVHARLEDT